MRGEGSVPVTGRSKAAVYLRVSTKEQAEMGGEAEGYSIPAQREACIRKAETLNADVVEEFVDRGESAKSADRPELQRLLTFVKKHSVQYVIVHKVDRLARNRYDDVTINVALQQAGVTLVSCTESIDETPSGMLMHGMLSAFAEFYSRNLAAEVMKGTMQKVSGGGTVGKAPTGYLNFRALENGREVRTVIVDPDRGPLVREAFELYATGEWTVRTLADELAGRGLTSVPTAKRAAKPITATNVQRMLRHPYYKGIVRYKGVEYEGKHEPLVTPGLWQQVQDVLTAQNYAGEKSRKHQHYLKGTVFCGNCGDRLVIHKATGKTGIVYPYFVCQGRHEKRTTCMRRAMRIDYVEALIEAHYYNVQLPHVLADGLREMLMREIRQNRQAADTERVYEQTRRQRLEERRRKLLEGYMAGAVPVDLLKEEQRRLTTELDASLERLKALEVEFETVERNLNEALRLA
jgi:DNA invertase Pin-like site-specific DNA recombinase